MYRHRWPSHGVWRQKTWGRHVAIAGVACALANCTDPPISQADVMGEYHADLPPGMATLVIRSEYTWEYRISGSRDFVRSGKWQPEPSMTTPSIYALSFERFEFGFPLSNFDPPSIKVDWQKPSFWPAQFSYYAGKARVCVRDGQFCFKHS